MGVPARKGALGRKDYRAYIQSQAWRDKRQAFINSKLSKDCSGCGLEFGPGFHLHHKTYKNLGVERLMDLVMLCPSCHELVHEKKTRDLWKQTSKVLKRQRKRHGIYGRKNSRL